ncbi:MAG: STAS domain-containing protein, partial [Phycisphaerales bacterium]
RAEIAVLCRSHNSRLIVLSMRNTETLASSVLGALAQLSADLERVGGVLVLYKVPREVSRVLRKTRLDRLIHTARDRAAAKKKAKSIAHKGGFLRRTNAA